MSHGNKPSEWEPLQERSSHPLSTLAPFFSQEALALGGIAGSLGSFSKCP